MKMKMLFELQIAIYLSQCGQKLVAVSSLQVDEKYATVDAPSIHFLLCISAAPKYNVFKFFRWTLTSAGPRSSS